GALALTLTGTGAIPIVKGASGADVLTLGGSLAGAIDLLGGADVLTFGPGSSLIGNAQLGSGADTLVLNGGTVAGTLDGGAGEDTIELQSGNPLTNFTPFAGFETFVSHGTLHPGGLNSVGAIVFNAAA